jgi:hypothetical protein
MFRSKPKPRAPAAKPIKPTAVADDTDWTEVIVNDNRLILKNVAANLLPPIPVATKAPTVQTAPAAPAKPQAPTGIPTKDVQECINQQRDTVEWLSYAISKQKGLIETIQACSPGAPESIVEIFEKQKKTIEDLLVAEKDFLRLIKKQQDMVDACQK